MSGLEFEPKWNIGNVIAAVGILIALTGSFLALSGSLYVMRGDVSEMQSDVAQMEARMRAQEQTLGRIDERVLTLMNTAARGESRDLMDQLKEEPQ